jgi:hypothetical protein
LLPQTNHAMGNLRFETYRDAFASPLTPSSTVFAYRHVHVSLIDNLIIHSNCVITVLCNECIAAAPRDGADGVLEQEYQESKIICQW